MMPLIVYLDEAGDHSLAADDKNFPIFALVMLVCEFSAYAQQIVPAVFQLKMDYWGHESIILHSRDIRKCKDSFSFLLDPAQRPRFYERIIRIMLDSEYRLIPIVVRKKDHKEKHGVHAENPYDLALRLAMEQLVDLLEEVGQDRILIVAEARGKKEDAELAVAFDRTRSEGSSNVPRERFARINFELQFVPKMMNVVGTQMADLAAYPIARAVLDPNKPNPAYEIVRRKIYLGNEGRSAGPIIVP
jgi:hypothetical protein